MKFALSGLALLLLAFAKPTARYDYPWPDQGIISFDVPPTWAMSGVQAGDVGFNFRVTPRSGAAAILQISLLNLPPDKPMQAANLQERLHDMVRPYIVSSVEGKFTVQTVKTMQGTGCYAQFTDAALVGRPSEPGNYKVMRNGLLLLDDHALVVVTMQFDDPKGSEPAEMLAIAGSMRLKRGSSAQALAHPTTITIQRVNGTFEVAVPQSKVVLVMPQNDLAPQPIGPNDGSRYFFMTGATSGIAVSGWFESGNRFKDIKEFWAGEEKGLAKGGFTAKNVAFLQAGDWQVVVYELHIPGTKLIIPNVRAEQVQAGTWIDLHLSLTSDRTPTDGRDRLLAILRSSQVRVK